MKKIGNFQKFLMTLLVGVIALAAEFIFHQPNIAFWLILIIGGLTTISMFIAMIKTLKSGKYGVDILAITAIVATLFVGEYWASLVVLIMLTGGDSLEDYATKEAGRELSALLKNTPVTAHRISHEKMEDILAEKVQVGDLIIVKPGEVVPVDGHLEKGLGEVDESSLTGESRPVEKKIGDLIMSGSVNGDVALYLRVIKKASDSQYQTLVKLVKESKAKPAHFVRLADQYAVPFTIAAYLIGGVAWFVSKDPVRFAQVLVVASPCPLILAAPVALVAGMSRSSRHGIIVKTGTTLEKLAKGKTVAFDKTGTLTKGQLAMDKINLVNETFSKEKVLQYVASAEQNSTHILARSLVIAGQKQELTLLPVTHLKEITGQGIIGTIEGQTVKVGKKDFILKEPDKVKMENQTAVFVAINDTYVGYITFHDVIRKEARETITGLKELGVKNILMLTGDQEAIAKTIASEVGITQVHANCLPEEKISTLKNQPEDARPVIMVGDGVNDAPALAISDVGIAMGAHGDTAASESASAVILKDSLTPVKEAIKISQDTMRIARESVLIGLAICVVLMLIAATGAIPTLIGAALQEVVDTVSILSALRARKDRS